MLKTQCAERLPHDALTISSSFRCPCIYTVRHYCILLMLDYLSSLITSTKWASLLSLKFLDRRGKSAEWSIPMAPPLHVFFSFSCSISHSDVWLLVKASNRGLSNPFRALGLQPAEITGEHFKFEASWGEEVKEVLDFTKKNVWYGCGNGSEIVWRSLNRKYESYRLCFSCTNLNGCLCGTVHLGPIEFYFFELFLRPFLAAGYV